VSTTTKYKQPTYKKREELKNDIDRYSAMYPWYSQIVDEIRATLAARTKNHDGDHAYCVSKYGRLIGRLGK